ncbi:DUF881 domain-containing protein [Jatrophihabitans sp. DSM 45814]
MKPILTLRRKPDVWTVLVPIVALLAGLLVVTTAHTARGTDLRSAGQTNLADLIRAAESRGAGEDAQVQQLQKSVADATAQLAKSDAGVAAINDAAKPLQQPVGLTAVSGPGLSVVLDDSHQNITDPNVDPNWLVVHQSDMQAAVNALWAGGAEAMQVQDQRLIATSAIRCVGNTLLLNGRVYSPPFTIAAIGPADAMRRALDSSHNLSEYRKDAASYGLRYSVNNENNLRIAAYDAPIALNYAKIGG